MEAGLKELKEGRMPFGMPQQMFEIIKSMGGA